MIGYLYLTLALIAGLTKGLFGKKVSRDVITLKDGFTVNTIRTVFCALVGFLVAIIQVGINGFYLSVPSLIVCLASSIFMAMFSMSWLYAYKSEAYVFLNIFTMLGSVVTALLGWAIYGDKIRTGQIAGFILLFVAVYIISLYNKNIKGKMSKRAIFTLLIGGVGVALSDFMQKVFVKQNLGEPSVFTFYTYFLMIIPQIIALVLFKFNKSTPKNPTLCNKRHILIFFVISSALYLNVIMKTMAVGYIPSTRLYPTLQGANLIASALCASLFFKEKITAKSIIGISIALVAVIVMNI